MCRLLRSLPVCTLHVICILEMCGPGSCILDKPSELAAHHTHLQEILKGLQDQWNEGAENLYSIFITNFPKPLVGFPCNIPQNFITKQHFVGFALKRNRINHSRWMLSIENISWLWSAKGRGHRVRQNSKFCLIAHSIHSPSSPPSSVAPAGQCLCICSSTSLKFVSSTLKFFLL